VGLHVRPLTKPYGAAHTSKLANSYWAKDRSAKKSLLTHLLMAWQEELSLVILPSETNKKEVKPLVGCLAGRTCHLRVITIVRMQVWKCKIA